MFANKHKDFKDMSTTKQRKKMQQQIAINKFVFNLSPHMKCFQDIYLIQIQDLHTAYRLTTHRFQRYL